MATSCCGVKKPKLNMNGDSASGGGNSSSTKCCNNCQCNTMSGGLPGGNACCINARMSCSMVVEPTNKGRQRVICVDMVIYCFDVLYSYLHNSESPKTPKFTNDHFPLFVTWKLGKDKKLRGCIGTFNSTSLHQGLREYAITSACKDSRFDPINTDEFGRLHCSVSLLMDFEVAEHYLDWEIGTHGIRIEFNSEKGSKKAATYLPEVAVEQGWNQIQTIDSLLRKGGYKGTITGDVRSSICLIRFQSEKMTVSYQEYIAHKSAPSSQYSHMADDPSLPSKVLISGGGDMDLRHHHNHAASSSNGMANGNCGGHQFQSRISSSGSGSGRHSLSRHRSSSTGGRHSPSNQRDSHHPSANAARYLPLPNHPYYPPPPPL